MLFVVQSINGRISRRQLRHHHHFSTRHMKNGQQSFSCLDVTQLYHHIPVYVFHISSVTAI